MRILLAAFICITFIGGLGLYMSHRAGAVPVPQNITRPQTARAHYSLTVTTTFAIEPDPFAIQTEDSKLPAGLIIRLGKKEILRKTEQMDSGIPVTVNPLEGLTAGSNEIYLEASPPVEDSDKSHAVRIMIMEDDFPVAEKTFWSQPGSKVADIMRFTIEEQHKKEDDHDS